MTKSPVPAPSRAPDAVCFPHPDDGRPVLQGDDLDLRTNLAALVRFAATHADTEATAARLLRVSVPELRRRVRAFGVSVPWGARR